MKQAPPIHCQRQLPRHSQTYLPRQCHLLGGWVLGFGFGFWVFFYTLDFFHPDKLFNHEIQQTARYRFHQVLVCKNSSWKKPAFVGDTSRGRTAEQLKLDGTSRDHLFQPLYSSRAAECW